MTPISSKRSSGSCASKEADLPERVSTCVWLITPEVLLAIDARLGDPDDAYVNGSQVWIVDYPDFTLEWRLHPVAGFQPPAPPDLLAEAVFLMKTDTGD